MVITTIQPPLDDAKNIYKTFLDRMESISNTLKYKDTKKTPQERMKDIEEQTAKSKADIDMLNKNIRILQFVVGGGILVMVIAFSTWIFDSTRRLSNMQDNFYNTADNLGKITDKCSSDNHILNEKLDGIDEKIDNKINKKLIEYKLLTK